MASLIKCERNHKNNINRFEFLMSVAEDKPFLCAKCGSKLVYTVKHFYPNHNRKAKYTLESVTRIIGDEKYIPLLLKIKDSDTRKRLYWLQYWVKVNSKWKYGQYAPILNKKQIEFVSNHL